MRGSTSVAVNEPALTHEVRALRQMRASVLRPSSTNTSTCPQLEPRCVRRFSSTRPEFLGLHRFSDKACYQARSTLCQSYSCLPCSLTTHEARDTRLRLWNRLLCTIRDAGTPLVSYCTNLMTGKSQSPVIFDIQFAGTHASRLQT